MSRDEKDTVYCSIQMSLSSGQELMKLVLELRASGAHDELEAVFTEMIDELQRSIDFVQEMLRGLEAINKPFMSPDPKN
jgi:hypothetical protein